MGDEGFLEGAQYRVTLQPARLHRRQHPLHEAAARRAVTPEGVLPPQYTTTPQTLRVVVRRLAAAVGHSDGRTL